MKLFKKRVITIIIFYIFLFPLRAASYDFNPLNKNIPEERKLNELYRYPMSAIKGLLYSTEQNCNRLPSEKEFKDFILNGEHKSIQCSKTIKTAIPLKKTGNKIGKSLPHLPEFLKSNQYQVYSDTKKHLCHLETKAE